MANTQVLIVEPDLQSGMRIESCVEGLRFSARVVNTLRACISEMAGTDILILSDELPNGQFGLGLSRWTETNGGPALILSREDLPVKQEAAMFRMGATNILRDRTDIATLQLLIVQYARRVKNEKDIAALKAQVKYLFYAVIAEGLMLCALGGPPLVETVSGLLKGAL